MAQIKIIITIEATLMRDAHEAVDAMDAKLRTRDGRVVRARLTQKPMDRIAAKQDWSRSESCNCRDRADSETDAHDDNCETPKAGGAL